MAYEIRISRRALSDLRHIYGSIRAETSQAAQKWFVGLQASIFSLETYPNRGPMTRERPALRHLLYGSKPHVYRIIYSIQEKSRVISIVQIRHGAREPLDL